MKEELRNELLFHLGELLYLKTVTFDWMESDKITRKLRAIYTLLEIDKDTGQTFNEFAKDVIKKMPTNGKAI